MAASRSALRVLVCPQEFKGSLTATEAARALAVGVGAAIGPDASVVELPLGDGGPGTVDACLAATEADRVTTEVHDLVGDLREVEYALLRDSEPTAAVIESSAACGLTLVDAAHRSPATASTTGVGELVADAVHRGARRIVVGDGGTGTNDGGAGAAEALGLRPLDSQGQSVPRGPLGMARLAEVRPTAPGSMDGVELRVAVDVTNQLLGPEGATSIYGPQKGVADWQLPAFDAALRRWADALEIALGDDFAALPGAGAGGGLAVGLLAAVRAAGGTAEIDSGSALVADLVGLDAAIEEAELVVTGEGSIDEQTAYGKTVAHVAARANAAGKPCVAVGGLVNGRLPDLVDVEASAPPGVTPEAAMALGAPLLEAAAERLVRRWVELER